MFLFDGKEPRENLPSSPVCAVAMIFPSNVAVIETSSMAGVIFPAYSTPMRTSKTMLDSSHDVTLLASTSVGNEKYGAIDLIETLA